MAEDRYLDKAQARDIEEELFATRRQQASRHMPVPLPRQNFWEMVGKLLAGFDDEIQEIGEQYMQNEMEDAYYSGIDPKDD